jgi:flavodoxin/Fe-S-cluster-containing hydrogenase component 2
LKSAIIYFSQTGNTEKVANSIYKGIKQAGSECDIFKIKEADPRRLYEYDLIGIGSPVFGAEPANVSDFINKMQFVGGKQAFVFCTHGTSPMLFFPSIIPKLIRKGLTVIGMGNWYGNCYLLHMPEPYPTAGHPDSDDLKEAEEFGKQMVDRSHKITGGETGLIPPVPPSLPPMMQPAGKNKEDDPGWVAESFKDRLIYHKEKCKYPKCRLCMDNCPVDGIDLSMNPPVIARPCLVCEFCARICPTGALNMDEWVPAMAQVTAKIIPRSLFPALDKAESEGKFRRLLPENQIRTDVFGYMSHKKHPQWIIGKGPQK